MTEQKKQRLLLIGTTLAYCLIGIEIIVMISPFALYFYSVYGPVLRFFSSNPLLSWTTEFFLPHMVFVDDKIVLGLSYLQVLLVLGLVLFLGAAIPLYYGRFTKKGVVQMSFYSKIRHPQYLFLAISGFGLLLYWPRFIILIMYISMLFVYYMLARNEEWRMKLEAPGVYEEYLESTPMFIPGEPGGKIYRLLFSWIKPKWVGIFAAYLVTMGLSIMLAMGIRNYTVNQLPIVSSGSMSCLSVFPRPTEEVVDLCNVLQKSPQVSAILNGEVRTNLAYVFPGDYFLTAIVTDEDRRFSDDIIERFPEVLEWHQHKFRGGLGKFFKIFYNYIRTLSSIETDYDVERIVFVEVTDTDGSLVPEQDLFDLGLKRRPVLLVDIDSFTHEIISIIKTTAGHKWGDMPMPTF